MAYVHCHSCNWSQDDFWHRGYNPLRFFLKNELANYIAPRFIGGDPEFVRHTKLSRFLGLTRTEEKPLETDWYKYACTKSCLCAGEAYPTTYTRHSVFSWLVLLRSSGKWIHRVREQVWWTNNEWKQAIADNGGHWPSCPKCGKDNLDID